MVSFCIKLFTMYFCNIKQLKKGALEDIYKLSFNSCRSLLLLQRRKALINKPISNTLDHQTFCKKHDKVPRSITFCNKGL